MIRIASPGPTGTSGARRAVRVVERSGQVYYVEYRINSGRDRVATRNRFKPALGVRVLRRNPAGGGALVLDATPSRKNTDYANSLAVGRGFTTASGQVTIRVLAVGASGATVRITRR